MFHPATNKIKKQRRKIFFDPFVLLKDMKAFSGHFLEVFLALPQLPQVSSSIQRL